MAVQVDKDMERAFAQLYEIQKRLLNGSLSSLAARQPLQDIIEGKSLEPTRQTAAFAPHLLSLEAQLESLREFNRQYWNNWLNEDQFEAAGQLEAYIDWETAADPHVQSVDNLEILYVDFGSPQVTVERWWQVIVGIQPGAWRWDGLKTDEKHLRLSSQARRYEPGIHRVCINLTAHWEPQAGRSVDEVRQQAAGLGESLAAAETLAAYSLHSELLRQMDGENLPYADLAGYEVSVSGDQRWASVPCLSWRQVDREVRLNASWAGDVDYQWAAPVVGES